MDIERIVREVKAEAEQILGSGSGFSASQSFTPMTGYSGPASGDAARIVQEVKEEVSRLGGLGGQIDYQTPAAGSTVHSYMSPESLAGYIDHTLLKAEATEDDIRKLCDEAKRYHFASVCVNTCHIKLAAELLSGSGVTPCCVVGFPLGAMSPESKAAEAAKAADNGAREVDMVINIGAIKSKNWQLVKRDIEGVVNAVRGRALVKVIIETCLLTDEEKVKACTVSKLAGAHFVKTSTGFSTDGADENDVRLMRQTVGPDMGVKASGGIKTYDDAVRMIQAGASRLGTSSGIAIIKGTVSTGHKCIDCGACRERCPAGVCTINKQSY